MLGFSPSTWKLSPSCEPAPSSKLSFPLAMHIPWKQWAFTHFPGWPLSLSPALVLRAYSIRKCSTFYLLPGNLHIIFRMILFLLVYMCVYANECRFLQQPEEGVRSWSWGYRQLWTDHLGAGNQTLVLSPHKCRCPRRPAGDVECTGAGVPGGSRWAACCGHWGPSSCPLQSRQHLWLRSRLFSCNLFFLFFLFFFLERKQLKSYFVCLLLLRQGLFIALADSKLVVLCLQSF